MGAFTESGIPGVGRLSWGAHFCQFYETARDLAETLVPYFKAGLEQNERCLWVASPPFTAEDAVAALRAAVPDLDRRIRRGQIDIINYDDWYTRNGALSVDEVLDAWLRRSAAAQANGYTGLRATGNTFWLEHDHWDSFDAYESRVSECFHGNHIVALCSYCLSRCQPGGVLDVVRSHQFAVARRAGQWEVLESASLRTAKAELAKLNAELERRVEEQTAELRRALEHASRARDEALRAKAAAERADLAKTRFLAAASHDLRQPFQAMSLFHELLSRRIDDCADRKALDGLGEALKGGQELLTALLDVSVLDAGVLAPQVEATTVRHVLDGLAAEVRVQAGAKGLQLRYVPCDLALETDPVLLARVVRNLLANAIKYTRTGRILLGCRRSGDGLRIEVWDTGVGIPADKLTEVFEDFVQLGNPERDRSKGLGVGLAVVARTCALLGYRVGVRSWPGEGSVFFVVIPHATNHLPAGLASAAE